MTHPQLVETARRWLCRRCSVVTTEIAGSGRDEPDALGWYGYGSSIFIECKVTRSDFLADRDKMHRRFPEHGIGQYRYYMAPAGLIRATELPDGYGLLEVKGKRIMKTVQSRAFDGNMRDETQILMSIIRRIGGNAPATIAVKFYTYETKGRATVGVRID